jgi:hypothetical protein
MTSKSSSLHSSANASATLSNDAINELKKFADILNEANNKINIISKSSEAKPSETKSNETKSSEAKPSESKTSETKSNETKSKSKSTRTKSNINSEHNQISSCINRRLGLLYGIAHHLTTKKQTKILKKWLDELIVKTQLLANNEIDTDESDDST